MILFLFILFGVILLAICREATSLLLIGIESLDGQNFFALSIEYDIKHHLMLDLLGEHGLRISKGLQTKSIVDTVKLLKHHLFFLSEHLFVIVGCVLFLALEADLLSWI